MRRAHRAPKTHGFGRKIDSDQCGDICRRERVAGDIGGFRQTGIDVGVEVFHPKPAALGQRRNLIIIVGSSNRAAFEAFRGVANSFHDGRKALEFGAPFPHGNQRLVFRRRPEQRLRRKDLFEIAPDCRNLTDRSAVFQNECGYYASRIDRAVGIGVLLALGEINRCKRDSDAFLSEEDPNPPGVRRRGGMVESQVIRHQGASSSYCCRYDDRWQKPAILRILPSIS